LIITHSKRTSGYYAYITACRQLIRLPLRRLLTITASKRNKYVETAKIPPRHNVDRIASLPAKTCDKLPT